ncbi:hypothetical protein RclHR1_08610006 [Rhizophagus clarus]|uniref:Uncharacterized protein n=1 Tax=Rhizophagus clarus TaxID=94130 RepID=A0A2Z6SNT0_9GLOM|nr:hypothetical protein RclHR1_08610006 [Rhizophagus clarus]
MKVFHGQNTFYESKRFQFLKYGTGALASIFYLLYLTYLIVQINNDKPLIQTSYETLPKMDIPAIEVCGVYSEIVISKCDFTWDDDSTTSYDGCNAFQHTTTKGFCHIYTNDNATIFYGNSEENLKGPWVQIIDFYFQIVNISAITSRYLSVATISGQLIDSEIYKKNPNKANDVFYLQDNAFAGIQNMSTRVTFKKVTERTIFPHDASIIIGENINYNSTPYLIVKSEDFPLHPNDSFTDTGHFSVAPSSFTHEVKSEKRSHTILGALGLAGGAFGLVSGIFTLLFGQPRINPWGVVHRSEKLKTAYNADLQNFPFITPVNPTQDPNVSIEQRVERLETRILELENVLTDVFNPSALERLTDNV